MGISQSWFDNHVSPCLRISFFDIKLTLCASWYLSDCIFLILSMLVLLAVPSFINLLCVVDCVHEFSYNFVRCSYDYLVHVSLLLLYL